MVDLKEEFSREDEKANKIAELRRLKQEKKTIEEFVQEFRRVVRESKYKRHPLIEEFKRDMNRTIYQKLIELK